MNSKACFSVPVVVLLFLASRHTNYLPVDQFAPEGGSDFYLHHAVFVNRSVRDLTCQFMPGERFAASGGERMPFVIPNGYGYPIKASDRLTALMHIQNFTAQSRQVYLEYSFTIQDLSLIHI